MMRREIYIATNYTDNSIYKSNKYIALLIVFILLSSCKKEVSCDIKGPTEDLSIYLPLHANVTNSSCNPDFSNISFISKGITPTTNRNSASNGAYQFNGVDGIIYADSVSLGTDVTMSCWVKADNLSQNAIIMYYGHAGKDGFGLIISSGQCSKGNKIIVLLGGINCDNDNSTEFLIDTNWHHLTLVKKDKLFSLFDNGVQKLTYTRQSSEPTKRLHIGAHLYSSVHNVFFEGKISDVRLYNRALTPDEVQNVYSVN
ncbi:hypothetical protein GCM10028805_43440 [Spirosoma harenae]